MLTSANAHTESTIAVEGDGSIGEDAEHQSNGGRRRCDRRIWRAGRSPWRPAAGCSAGCAAGRSATVDAQ